MADGTRVIDPVETSTITAGDTIATDAITDSDSVVKVGQKVQRIKLGIGADGEYADLSSTVPLPIISDQLKQNESVGYLLERIEVQMRIMNFHLAIMNGEEITEDDVQFGD